MRKGWVRGRWKLSCGYMFHALEASGAEKDTWLELTTSPYTLAQFGVDNTVTGK